MARTSKLTSFSFLFLASVRCADIVLVLVAILFPPAAAAMITGCSCGEYSGVWGAGKGKDRRGMRLTVSRSSAHRLFSTDLLINILLTCLGYFPGHIHAFWLIYKQMKVRFGREGGGRRIRAVDADLPRLLPRSFSFSPGRGALRTRRLRLHRKRRVRGMFGSLSVRRRASKTDRHASPCLSPARRKSPSDCSSPGQLRIYPPRIRRRRRGEGDLW